LQVNSHISGVWIIGGPKLLRESSLEILA